MNIVRGAFKSFVTVEVQKIKRAAISQVAAEGDVQVNYMLSGQRKLQKLKDQAQEKKQELKAKMDFKSQRREKVRDKIARNAIKYMFISKKRHIFNALRKAAKKQHAFIECVKNVLEKSMYMKGFTQIKNDSWKTYKDKKKYRHIDMMILRFMKANVGEYFDKWK